MARLRLDYSRALTELDPERIVATIPRPMSEVETMSKPICDVFSLSTAMWRGLLDEVQIQLVRVLLHGGDGTFEHLEVLTAGLDQRG